MIVKRGEKVAKMNLCNQNKQREVLGFSRSE